MGDKKAIERIPIEAHMAFCSQSPGNLIGHISEHDGTRRSIQACYIIEKFNPQNAKDFAKIIYDNNLEKGIIGWNLPMFLENKDLVDFCQLESQKSDFYSGKTDPWMSAEAKEKKKEWHEWYMHRCVAHADDVDLSADIWKLSPTIMENYPSERKMFMGTDIGQGWHRFKRESLEEMSFLEMRNHA